MARQIITSCCCCDLRTGVILIALFSMGIAAINIYTGVGAVLLLKKIEPQIGKSANNLPIPLKYYDDAINIGWSNIAFFASDLIISVVLLIGALQRNKCILTAWIVWTAVCLVYHLSVTIFFLSIWKGVPTFGYSMIFDIIIVVYFLLVVYSFKQEIIQRETQPNGPNMIVVPGVPAPRHYQATNPPQWAYPYPQQQQGYPQNVPPPYVYSQAPPPYAQYSQPPVEQKVAM